MTTKRICCRRADDTVVISCVPDYGTEENLMTVSQRDNPDFDSYHVVDITDLPDNSRRSDWRHNGTNFYLAQE